MHLNEIVSVNASQSCICCIFIYPLKLRLRIKKPFSFPALPELATSYPLQLPYSYLSRLCRKHEESLLSMCVLSLFLKTQIDRVSLPCKLLVVLSSIKREGFSMAYKPQCSWGPHPSLSLALSLGRLVPAPCI